MLTAATSKEGQDNVRAEWTVRNGWHLHEGWKEAIQKEVEGLLANGVGYQYHFLKHSEESVNIGRL